MSNKLPRPYWSSMTSYVLVTTGAIVGLGNIIRFPFYIYKFGGLFFLFYILCELLICIPLLFAELLIGRRGKQNPVGSFSLLAMETGASLKWRWIGWLCFIILLLSLGNYLVSVAFPSSYFIGTLSTPGNLSITQNTMLLEMCLIAFLIITLLVIARGINRGLETISCITVPLYCFILLTLAIYSCLIGNPMLALNHLLDFTPDDSIATVFLAALAYAFFKLNVGMGTMIVYGSYLPYSVPIARSTLIILILDTIISLLAYFVVCPLLTPDSGVTTVYSFQQTLYFFLQNHHGTLIAFFFFLVVIMAAWTATIAMAESAAVILIERYDISRTAATCLLFVGTALLGTAIILAYQQWGNILVFHQWSVTRFVDGVTATFLIPISAFLTAIFAGWIVSRSITASELRFNSVMYGIWRFLIRWVAPVCIVMTAVMLFSLGK